MPRADNEWGEWNESQYNVPPRPIWLEERLCKSSPQSQDALSEPQVKEKQTPSSQDFEEAYLPSLRDFRCWYIWARETGRHEIYLEKIEALALAFKLKTPSAEANIHLINPNFGLSAANLHNMRNDQNRYQEMVENFLRDAKIILDRQGIREICESENVLRYRSRNGEYILSYYSVSNRITVEKNGYLLAYQKEEQISVGNKFVTLKDAALFKRAVEG